MDIQGEKLRVIYPLDAWPRPWPTAVFAVQWLVILVPSLLVLGGVVAVAQGLDGAATVALLQRLLLVCALAQAAQVWLGHRLPGLVGPSAVLMVGVLSTLSAGMPAVYGALAVAGALAALVGFTGLAARLRRLYTPPVLATTLLLITVTLAPTMRDLCFHPATRGGPVASFLYALGLTLLMFWGQYRLKGLLSSATLLIGMVLGALGFHLAGLDQGPSPSPPAAGWGLPALFPFALQFQPGVIIAFILCYLALISNELATVEALGFMLEAPGQNARQNRAVAAAGLSGVLAGFMGVPGTVTYSLSPAMAITTKSASPYPLLPAAAFLLVLGLSPKLLFLFQLVPPPVVGAILLSLMASTVYAAISMLLSRPLTWRGGVVVGLAMTVGVLVAFMPPGARRQMPALLRPVLANGFVTGLGVAIVMEHLILRSRGSRR